MAVILGITPAQKLAMIPLGPLSKEGELRPGIAFFEFDGHIKAAFFDVLYERR